MDQLETQVTDLRFLTQTPGPGLLAAGGSTVAPSTHTSDEMLSPRNTGTRMGSTHPGNLGGSAPGENSAHAAPHTQQASRTPFSPDSGVRNVTGPASSSSTTIPAKRKPGDDDSGAAGTPTRQQRSKRNRLSHGKILGPCMTAVSSLWSIYPCRTLDPTRLTIAVLAFSNECKRRKIKCNGEIPCQRCGNLNLACLYSPNCCSNSWKDSDEYRQMTDKVAGLQEQIDTLFQNVNVLRQETQRLAPLSERILPVPSSTVSPSPSTSIPSLKTELAPIRAPYSFRGPTSISFTVDMAKNTLHNMGYSGEPSQDDQNHAATEAVSPFIPPQQPPPQTASSASQTALSTSQAVAAPSSFLAAAAEIDSLWDFDKDEMVRLCRVHEVEIGIMYPVVPIETVLDHAHNLGLLMETARKNGFLPTHYEEIMADMRTLTLKIIICSGLTVEEHGHSERAIRLYSSIAAIADRKLMRDPATIDNLPFLALVAGYHFLSNDEVLAWRIMGQVARLALEQGFHRKEGLNKIEDPLERRNAVTTFWTAYALDRRWSFGTGLPYVVDDDKIDPNLPLPEEYPYLVAMITYSRLGAKIWRLVDFFEPAIIRDLQREQFEELDRQLMQWYDSVPDEIRTASFEEIQLPSSPASYDLNRLQLWTRLRLNQMRIWLHTPILHSASSINNNVPLAQTAVDLAKETIHYLTRLNNSSDLYRRIQVFYHQFLTSAIAVLFLASTHQPVRFSAQCRGEFYQALNLIKGLSAKSWVSHRLWRTVRSLKAYAPRLGLQQQDGDGPASTPSPYSSTVALPLPLPPPRAGGRSNTASSASTYAPPQQTPNNYMHPNDSARSSPSVNDSRHNGNGSNGPWPLPAPMAASIPLSASSPFGRQIMNATGPATGIPHSTPSPSGLGPSVPPLQQQPIPHPSQGAAPDLTVDQTNGMQLQTEMTRIFEGYTALSGVPLTPSGGIHDGRYDTGEIMYEQLKNLF